MRTKVNNKIVAMLWLVFVMSAVFVSELTLTVSAQNTADLPSRSVYTGTDGNSCKWSYDTTTRVLTVESNDSDAKTLHSLTGSNLDVVKANASRLVLKKIDTVMPSVFKGYKFSTIEFCPELRWIRDNAFENNISLTGIDLSGTTLFWIEPSAFKGCVNLKSVEFPDTLRQINESAFEGCTALREVDLSNTGVYIIDDSAFKECTFLGKMLFPDTLETLGDYAIYKCGSISDSNTEIASRLKELDLRMVKKFGDHAVSENRWLTTISISKKIGEIGGSVTSTTFVGNGRSVSAANGYWDTYFYGTEDLFNSIPNLKDNPFPKAVIYTEYPQTGHSLTKTDEVPATCDKDGKKAYWTCSACKKMFSDEKGEHEITEPEIIKATGHDWGEWKVTRDPEAGKAGERQRVCRNDPSHVEKETIPATGEEPEPAPEPVAPTKVSGTLMARMTAKGSNSLVLTWNKIKGAEGYDVFFVKCGKTTKCKKVRTIKAGKKLTWTRKGLKKKRAYKAYVKAWVMKDGKKTYVRKSPTVHAYTSGSKDRYTVAKSITIKNKKEVTLEVGKTYKIKAKINKLDESKELMTVFHAPKLRYKSTNTKVATVSKSGKIKAKAKGSCKIYVIAVNGARKTIRLTVR